MQSMEKAKNILVSGKVIRVVWLVAAVLIVVATLFAIFWNGGRNSRTAVEITPNENVIVVDVASGDTLSKILSAQGFGGGDINTIDKLLKKQAGVNGLRANRDKIEFVRSSPDTAVSKIVVRPGPWRRVELTCTDTGSWECNAVDIERDTRLVYRQGEILDGDSFYLAGIRAGIPAGVLADVYDLLAFEMDFERDVRAGQKFFVVYEENYTDDKMVDTGAVAMVSFDALRGNVKMYRFRKSDKTIGYYDPNGNGAIKSLKRTPINNAKVTSSFYCDGKIGKCLYFLSAQ